MPKTVKPDIRFVVSTTQKSFSGESNLELEAQLIVVMPDGKVRYPNFGWSDETGAGDYEGLKVRAHVYKDGAFATADWIYNQDPQVYDLYSVDVRRAESLARTLKRLQVKLHRLSDQLGVVRDLPDFLARLAIACGATTSRAFGVRSRDGQTWDDLGLRWMDINGLQMHLNETVKDWRS